MLKTKEEQEKENKETKMYNNWLQKLTESYTQAKRELTESEMILEELNETKEYAYILEHVLNTLLEHEVINEEIIMEALSPMERYSQAKRMGLSDEEAFKRHQSRNDRLSKIKKRADPDVWVDDNNGPVTQQWFHANELARSSDDESPTIFRRVPEGSPEEANIVDKGLGRAGITPGSTSYHQAMNDAARSLRTLRKDNREWRAISKRAARANEQGK